MSTSIPKVAHVVPALVTGGMEKLVAQASVAARGGSDRRDLPGRPRHTRAGVGRPGIRGDATGVHPRQGRSGLSVAPTVAALAGRCGALPQSPGVYVWCPGRPGAASNDRGAHKTWNPDARRPHAWRTIARLDGPAVPDRWSLAGNSTAAGNLDGANGPPRVVDSQWHGGRRSLFLPANWPDTNWGCPSSEL